MTTIWGGDTFLLSPGITSVSPSPSHPGDAVTITGSAFQPMQGSSTVTVCGIAATVISWSNTVIIVEIPAGATCGICDIVVTVAGESDTATITIACGDILRFVDYDHSLSGGADSGVLLDINDGTDYCLDEIEFPPPVPRIEWRDPAHGDGRDVSYHKYENREVTIHMQVFGTNVDDLSINIRALWERLLASEPVLEWCPEGWDERLYIDLISPPIGIDPSDWFETWIRDYDGLRVLSNLTLTFEAKPFLRGAEETVVLLNGAAASPDVVNCVTGIVLDKTNFKGDVPAPADIFIDLVDGTLWTDLIFGQRLHYSDDFDPIQEPATGAQVTPVAGRLNDDYRDIPAVTNLVLNPSFVTAGGGGADIWANWVEYTLTGGTLADEAVIIYPDGLTKSMKAGMAGLGSGYAGVTSAAMIAITNTNYYIFHMYAYAGRALTGYELQNLYVLVEMYDAGSTLRDTHFAVYNTTLNLTPGVWQLVTAYVSPSDWAASGFAITQCKINVETYGYLKAAGYHYYDALLFASLGSVTAEADFPLDSHEGRYLPIANVTFDAANAYDDITFNALLETDGGAAITPSIYPQVVDPGDPNTNFREIALLGTRPSVISIPTHRISSLADKTNIVQSIRLATDSLSAEDFWVDYIGIVPTDRAYSEVRNWSGNEHLILDGRSSNLALSSITGSLDDAMVYDINKQKSDCSFVADPRGFNGTLVALTNVSGDDQVTSVVDVTMKYSPLYLLVPEE